MTQTELVHRPLHVAVVLGLTAALVSAQPGGAVHTHRVPSGFVANAGQWPSPARFVLRRSDMNAHFEPDAVTLEMYRARSSGRVRGHVVRLAFQSDAAHDATTLAGEVRLPGHHNYLIGASRDSWRVGVPLFARIVYRNVAPGIDVRFREHGGHLEYDLLVAAGADPRRFAIECAGVESIRLREDGSLVLDTGSGELVQPVPETWQVQADGSRRTVRCRYRVLGPARYGFVVDADAGSPIVIDPTLKWSTFLGGVSYDYARDVEVGTGGSVYVTGYSVSAAFPTTTGAFDTTYNGAEDTFIAKLNSSGSTLVYATYLGGSLGDVPYGLAVTLSGEATVIGFTTSRNFPTSSGAYQTRNQGGSGEVFVTRLDPSGAALRYSTYLGTREYDWPGDVTVLPGGDTVVVGWTKSTAFPTTAGAFSRTYKDKGDGFVTRLNSGGTGLVFSTYLNSNGWDELNAIRVDLGGHLAIGGTVWVAPAGGSDFPTTAGAFDRTFNGGLADAFVVRLHSSGSSLLYSTFVGGNADDFGRALALQATGEAVLGGKTASLNFPTVPGSYDTTPNGMADAFVSRLSSTGGALLGSTFLGGSGNDTVMGLSVTAANAVLAGGVARSGFPTTADAIQRTYGGGTFDGVLVALDTNLQTLSFATFLGGAAYDGVYGLAVDGAGNPTVVGEVFSSAFPVTAGSADPTYNGGGDAFVSHIELTAPPTFTTTVTSLNPAAGVTITSNKQDKNGRTSGATPFTFTYEQGTQLLLTAPATSTVGPFVRWHLDGVPQAPGQRTLAFTQTADAAAQAEYAIPTFTTTVTSLNPAAGVTITSNKQDKNGRTSGATPFTFTYEQGTQLLLTAPATSTVGPFVRWHLDGVPQAPGQRTLAFTQTADAAAQAEYAIPTFTTTVTSLNPAAGVTITSNKQDKNGRTSGATPFTFTYEQGTQLLLTAPATSTVGPFVRWHLDGVPQAPGQRTLAFTQTADAAAQAEYAIPTFTTTVTSLNPAAGVTITSNKQDKNGRTSGATPFTFTYEQGTQLLLTAPATSTVGPFVRWHLDGVPQAPGQRTLAFTQTADAAAQAEYAIPTFTTTVTSLNPAAGVTITSNKQDKNGRTSGATPFTFTYEQGTQLLLTAPATSTVGPFVRWHLDGVPQAPGQRTLAFTQTADAAAQAEYEIPTFTTTVTSLNPAAGVTITSNKQDKNGRTSGATPFTFTYEQGTQLLLTAPATSTVGPFVRWHLDGVPQAPGQRTLAFTQTADAAAQAEYEIPTFTTTVTSLNPAAGVTITSNKQDKNGRTSGATPFTFTYEQGTQLLLTAPATSTVGPFVRWHLDGVPQAPGQRTLAFTQTADAAAQAEYEIPTFTTTVTSLNPAAGVTITSNKQDKNGRTSGATPFTFTYEQGTQLLLTAPATSTVGPFVRWHLDGVPQAPGQRTLAFTQTADAAAQAEYAIPTFTTTVTSLNPAAGVTITSNKQDKNGRTSGATPFTFTYEQGTQLLLTAPATSTVGPFVRWHLDGVPQAPGQRTLAFTQTADAAAQAEYEIPTFTTTVTSLNPAAGVTITSNKQDKNGRTSGATPFTFTYEQGTQLLLTAPATSTVGPFVRWHLDGVPQAPGQRTLAFTQTADAAAQAEYEIPTFTTTVTSLNPAAGVTITSNKQDKNGRTSGATPFTFTYEQGTQLLLTAPATSTVGPFVRWHLDGVPQAPGQRTLAFTQTADAAAQAEYAIPTFTTTVTSLNPAAGVTITSDKLDKNGRDRGATPFTLTYDKATQLTLTAPATSTLGPFLRWHLDGVPQTTGQRALVFTQNADAVAHAEYSLPIFTTTVSSRNPSTGVTITSDTKDTNGRDSGATVFTLSYRSGTNITLTAPAASPAGAFQRWHLDGVPQTIGQRNLAFAQNADRAALAEFAIPTFKTTVTSLNPATGVEIISSVKDRNGRDRGRTVFTLTYDKGTLLTLSAPASSTLGPFLRWHLDGVPHAVGQRGLTFTQTADRVARAEYTVQTFTTTVTSLNPSTGVAITSDTLDVNGTDRGATTFALIYRRDTAFTLTAPVASTLGPFKRWSLDGIPQRDGLRTLTISQSVDRAARAEYWIHTHGTFASYGQGCPGTGSKIPALSGTGHPDIGQLMGWALTNARASSAGVLMVGRARQSIDLGLVGMPGCLLLVQPIAEVPVFTSGAGTFALSGTLPRKPGLIGAHLTSQLAILDPGTATPTKVVTSNGVDATLGGNR